MQLTTRAIADILEDKKPESPCVQVLAIKKIVGGGNMPDRYRVLLSDGVFSQSSNMLATQLNYLVTDNKLDAHSIITLDKYVCNPVHDRKLVILMGVTVVATSQEAGNTRIGNPVPYKFGVSNQQPAEPAPMPEKTIKSDVKPDSRVPMQTMDNQPKQAGFYNTKPSGGFSVKNVPNTPGGTPTRVQALNTLTPYQNRWTIRARVSQKSAVRTWSNSRGEGKLFSMNLIDESGEIRATLFKEQVDKYFEMVELNKVYYISKASLKTADKRFSSVANDYEMTFNNDTQMWLCEEETSLPKVTFNFVPISDLEKHEASSMIDVIGVVKQVEDLNTVVGKKSNREIKKRDVHLVDSSQMQVRLTLWGADAEGFEARDNPVLAIKGARLSDWNGRSLSATSASQLVLNPDVDEAHSLAGWYENEGRNVQYSEYTGDRQGGSAGHATTWRSLLDVQNSAMTATEAVYYNVKGTLMQTRTENAMYMACPSGNCNKKVIDQTDGTYRCEKCNKDFPNFSWRMILQCQVWDTTAREYVTFFQDHAEKILGTKAADLGELRQNDQAAYEKVINSANYQSFIFKMRSKTEEYNNENRIKTVAVEVNDINVMDRIKTLTAEVETLLGAVS